MSKIHVELLVFQTLAVEIGEIEDTVSRFKSLEMKLFPIDVSEDEEERNTLMELALGRGRITLTNAPVSRLGKRIIFLFSKEKDDVVMTGDSVSVEFDFFITVVVPITRIFGFES